MNRRASTAAVWEAGYRAGREAAAREAAEALRCDEEALRAGVLRVYRTELKAAWLRGRIWGQRDMVRRLRGEHFEDADLDTPIPFEGAAG